MTVSKEALHNQVKDLVCEILDIEHKDFDPSKSFADMGMDSLASFALVKKLQTIVGDSVELQKNTVFKQKYMNSLVDYIYSLLA